MNSDDAEEFKQALAKFMAIVDRLDARNMQTAQRIEAATGAIEQGASRLDSGGERFAHTALGAIRIEARQTIAEGAGQAVGEIRKQLQQASASVELAGQDMETQRKGLTAARRTLVWNGLLALLIGSLLAAGGVGFFAWKSMRDIAQAQFAKDVLQATQSGALNRCGGSLCMRVGKKPQRFGSDYILMQE